MRVPLFLFLFISYSSVFGQYSKRVLIIGIDGCRPDALQVANTPTIDSLLLSSSYSLDAVNDDITFSGPGWSAMLTGVWSDKHGVTNNSFSGSNYNQHPHFFKRVEDARPDLNTVSISQWHPINNNLLLGNADFIHNASGESDVTAQAVDRFNNHDPHLIFLHYDDVDHAGHGSGFSPTNPSYLTTIEGVDAEIGIVLNALKNRATFDQEKWLILLSTDHGGNGTSHGGTSPEEEQIFFIAHNKDFVSHQILSDSTYLVDTSDCLSLDKSLQFDGSDDFVNVPHFNDLNFGLNQDFTIECRVKTDLAADVSILANKDWDSGSNAGFVFSFKFSSGPEWKVNIGDGSNRADINTGGAIADNYWHHLSVTFDRDGYMVMYEDGVKKDSILISAIQNIDNGHPLRFGADVNGAYDFKGSMAEVRFWDTVLPANEIDAWKCDTLNNQHSSYANLIGYWPLNEGVGSLANDHSHLQNHGSISNATWSSSDSILMVKSPEITDVAVSALDWLCLEIDPSWALDGQSNIDEQNTVSTLVDSVSGSLRFIMNNVCANDTILFSPLLNGQDILVNKGVLHPITATIIKGNGVDSTLLSANFKNSIFRTKEGSFLSLEDLCLKKGFSNQFGGAIQNFGNLNLLNVKLEENFEGGYPKPYSNIGATIIKGKVEIKP